jgi:hypothetical protein
MQTIQLYYCNVWQRVWDTHGKIYEIKEHRGWKFVNYNNTKVGINQLPNKPLIRDFDDVCTLYIFAWHTIFPCPAIGYYVAKKSNPKLTKTEYYTRFKNQSFILAK